MSGHDIYFILSDLPMNVNVYILKVESADYLSNISIIWNGAVHQSWSLHCFNHSVQDVFIRIAVFQESSQPQWDQVYIRARFSLVRIPQSLHLAF